MQKRQITDRNGKIIYWCSKQPDPSKDTLFFLHGLTADHTMFIEQIRHFCRSYNIIVWDAPAHGMSRPYRRFTYENAVRGMKAILDECKVSQVILIGQSMGGFLSQSFITRYPDMAKAFISIDSTPYGDYYSDTDLWWLRQVGWMSMLFPEKLLKSSVSDQTAFTKAGRANMSSILAKYGKKELCRLMGKGYTEFIAENRELDIPCPVLLIVGVHDKTGKVQQYNREWSRRTGYPLKMIPHAAHNSNVDAPEAVNRCIEEFLDK